jgi:hypothetical protein
MNKGASVRDFTCGVTPGCHTSVCGVNYGSGVDLFASYVEQAFFGALGARWAYRLATLFGLPSDPYAWLGLFATSVIVGGGGAWYYYETLKQSSNPNVAIIANNPGTAFICAELAAGWSRAAYYVSLLFVPELAVVGNLTAFIDVPFLIGLAITYFDGTVLIYPVQDAMWLGVILWGKLDGWQQCDILGFAPPNQPVCNSWALRALDWLSYSFWQNAVQPLLSAVEHFSSAPHKALAAADILMQIVLLPPLIGLNLYVGFVDLAVGEVAKVLYSSGGCNGGC